MFGAMRPRRNRPDAPLVCRSSRIRRSSNAHSAHRASVPSAPASAVRPHPPHTAHLYRPSAPAARSPNPLRTHRPRRPTPSPRPHRPRARRAARRSPRHARSFTRRAIRLHAEILELQAFSFLQSILNFVVSLPNASEKDVKGLLFRKQPLHTSPNRSKKGEAGVSRLSSLRNLTSPPRLCSRVESQTDCSKPERFDELALA